MTFFQLPPFSLSPASGSTFWWLDQLPSKLPLAIRKIWEALVDDINSVSQFGCRKSIVVRFGNDAY